MTEQEAIEQFEERLAIEDYRKQIPKHYEAMEIAVKSLEEIQKYRELGTLDELNSLIAQSEEEFNMLIEYIAIGTVDECRSAVEKQRAKKPIRNDRCTCPSCGTYNETIKKRRNTVYSDIVYCWHCGQALETFRSDKE